MIGVLGSGSWATAVVSILLEETDYEINWWVREPEIVESVQKEGINQLYLREAQLDSKRLNVSSDIHDVVKKSDDVYVVIPSAFVASSLGGLSLREIRKKNWISATKGLITIDNLTVTQYLEQHYGVPTSQLAVVSGPSHAEDVARKNQTFLTVASTNEELIERVRQMLACRFITTTSSNDLHGIEYAAALKNVYAIGMGIAKGMGLGDNMMAVLVASAVKEMRYFLQEIYPVEHRDVSDYAYMGDLLVTCYSQFSRNRTFGQMIGHGYSIASAQHEMNMVAEGYYAVECLERIREQHDLDMPLLQAVYGILYCKVPPRVMNRKIAKIK